jgi:hypothetical protein
MSKAAPSVTAKKNGKVSINCKKLRDKIKSSDAWKNAEYVEIQYSTNKDFLKNAKTKKIKKGTFNKAKAMIDNPQSKYPAHINNFLFPSLSYLHLISLKEPLPHNP